jgi:hypothetical protein
MAMIGLEHQMGKDQLDFDTAKLVAENQLKSLERHAPESTTTTKSGPTPISHPLEAAQMDVWKAIAVQPFETILRMVSLTPPMILGAKIDTQFLCTYSSAHPANIISQNLLTKI